jgi:restriction endonuclease Mrr
MNELEKKEDEGVLRENKFSQDRDELYEKEKKAFDSSANLRNTLLQISALISSKISEEITKDSSPDEILQVLQNIEESIPIDLITKLNTVSSKTFRNMKLNYEETDLYSANSGGILSDFIKD